MKMMMHTSATQPAQSQYQPSCSAARMTGAATNPRCDASAFLPSAIMEGAFCLAHMEINNAF
jgi:hypothetical protein